MPQKKYTEEETKILKALGKAIREARNQKGRSQEKLAEETGLHRTYIGSVERGERNIGAINIVGIASTLKVPVGDFFLET
jgi:transcriptional regulator with XRE-family HTH domain